MLQRDAADARYDARVSSLLERRDARRTEVIEAACRVILRDGVGGASMKAIAKELGTTVGVITHNFADKDELVREALHHVVGDLFDSAVGATEGLSGAERLERMMEEALPTTRARHERWQVWVSFLGEIMGSQALLDDERHQNGRFLEAIRGVLEELKASKRLAPGIDPVREARAAMSLVDGLGLDAILHPQLYPPKFQREIVRRYAAQLTR
jgi:AcrR family transcriptional regulator